MAEMTKVSGVQEVLKNLNRAKIGMGKALERGLVKAGLKLRRESQKRVPVNYGNLKGSAFTRKEGSGLSAEVVVGYTASYAIYVHENQEMKLLGKPRPKGRGMYWDPRPQAGPKFLEGPARELKDELQKIIADEMKKG